MPIALTHAIRAVELVLRLAYFALAPAGLVLLATLFPIAGVVANIGFAVAVFAFASVVRGWIARFPVLRLVFGAQLKFEDFYKQHPPRSFLYYVFYPFLFPYWLSQPVPRREFGLYRGLTTVGLLILVGGAGWDFYRKWYPEVPFQPFGRIWAIVFAIQALIAIVIVMPLATTVITLKLQGRSGALGALFAVATASIVFAVAFTAKRRHEYVQVPTGERMLLRHRHASKTSRRLLEEALKRANISIRRGDADVVKAKAGVEILGGPIVDARDSLAKLYREDELPCFHLVSFAGRKGPILVVFGIRHGVGLLTERPMFWLAMRENGTFVDDPKDLPDGALAEMRRISKR